MTVHVVTDSTSDIPQAIANEHNITVIPLTITIGSESYRDGVDLDADAFYARLPDEKQLPATSQPPPALFQHAYEHLITRGEVVSVHLSHKFSGTVETARAVAGGVAPDKISVVDSGSASMGLGLCALAAARVAAGGGTRASRPRSPSRPACASPSRSKRSSICAAAAASGGRVRSWAGCCASSRSSPSRTEKRSR